MRALLFSLFVMSAPAHAASLHLCPQSGAPARPPFADTVAEDGTRLRWLIDEHKEGPGCAGIALPPGARVETLFPLAPHEDVDNTILLHGRVRDGRFAVSEHLLPSERPDTPQSGRMPLGVNLLGRMQARAFGVEERVRVRLEDGRLAVDCGAGARPAGALLSGPWFLPRARLRLAASYAGGAGFALQAADGAHAARETALALGALPARTSADAAPLRLALPAALDRAGWRHFVLQCPAQAASLTLHQLSLEPDPSAAARAPARATWVWQAADWRERGAALLDWAEAHRVRELFITVPFRDDAVREPARLAAFVRAAGTRGIRVLSVDGDPHMVLPERQPALARLVRAYAAYNAAAEPAARLAGLQFDVEPYLLQEYGAGKADWDARYLAMARTLRGAAGSLRLELVVPFWWDRKTALLDALAPLVDALAVMDYRTDPTQLTGFAVPFLDWGARHGRQVRIALEAGEIAPETQRRYVRAEAGQAGELLRLRVHGQQVLALLREPVAGAPQADLFRLQSTREIDAGATTFHRDKQALLRLLPALEADFGAWDDAFGGIALHELR
ncbi:hypothetical protein ACI48D_02400 [Massilia sp. LXY-6]|uniref:hypothetical protein n=1 Tax=Massilia sp. LXY-6 TaxID=3379823 RepID=UPI003EDF7D9E